MRFRLNNREIGLCEVIDSEYSIINGLIVGFKQEDDIVITPLGLRIEKLEFIRRLEIVDEFGESIPHGIKVKYYGAQFPIDESGEIKLKVDFSGMKRKPKKLKYTV